MSGGSMNYLSRRMEYEADFEQDTPEREAFAVHLKKVIKALHDIEWVDSGDYGPGDENAAIRACLAGGAKLRAAAIEARRVLSMPLLMAGDAPVSQALRMLDEALGDADALVMPQMLGDVWMAFGACDDGRLIALPEYAAASELAVGQKIMEVARREGYRGTLADRLQSLQWSVRRVTPTP